MWGCQDHGSQSAVYVAGRRRDATASTPGSSESIIVRRSIRWCAVAAMSLATSACSSAEAPTALSAAPHLDRAPTTIDREPIPRSTTAPAPVESVPPSGPVVHDLEPNLVVVDDDGVVTIQHPEPEPEMALHALTGLADEWVAVGSVSPTDGVGSPAIWSLSTEGQLGDVQLLPIEPGVPGVARDVLADDDGVIVVGSRDAGRNSRPTAWLFRDGSWFLVDLPVSAGVTHGAVADHVLRLNDGVLAVVGRGGGPFFSDLQVWFSADGGRTWTGSARGVAFYEPLVATDGERVAVIARAQRALGSGAQTYDAWTFQLADDGDIVAETEVNLPFAPGNSMWPGAMTWDGGQFVLGVGLTDDIRIATSPDGLDYQLSPFDPSEMRPGRPGNIVALSAVGSRLLVGVEQQPSLLVFERVGGEFSLVDAPTTPSGDLAYLATRRLVASTGDRFVYVGGDWMGGYTFLGWDGEAWTSRTLEDVPRFRNATRLQVTDMAVSPAGTVAVLAGSVATTPGDTARAGLGLAWRAEGEATWNGMLRLPERTRPLFVDRWGERLVLAGHDETSNTTRFYEIDPAANSMAMLGAIDGFVTSMTATVERLHVTRVDGVTASSATSALLTSADAVSWSSVPTSSTPGVVCSNDVLAAVVSLADDGGTSVLGAERIIGEASLPVAPPVPAAVFLLRPEAEQILRCAVNDERIVTTLQASDWETAEPSPQVRMVPWEPGTEPIDHLVLPVSLEGAWKSDVQDVIWSGSEWLAVGGGGDVEQGFDALIWRSTNGMDWQPPVTIAGGPGNQIANSIVVRDGTLLIGGVKGQHAVIWTLPG